MDRPLILGGGLAGSAAALTLARAGWRPLVLERSRTPADKLCGCFLSVETVAMLEGLGIDLDALSASRIDRLRLFHGYRAVEVPLPFVARALSRVRLDEALLERAAAAGACISRGATVVALETVDGGFAARLRGGDCIAARQVFLATGKHDLRGIPPRIADGPDYIGFSQRLHLSAGGRAALSGAIEIHLFEGGYAGLQPIEDGAANLCMIVTRSAFAACGGQWPQWLDRLVQRSPALYGRLEQARPLTARPLSITRIPYGYIHRPQRTEPDGLYRLGDQAAVIPSFTGDGMAIALFSGIVAARCLSSGRTMRDFHETLRARLVLQFRVAGALQKLAEGRAGRAALMMGATVFPGLIGALASRTRLMAADLNGS